LLQICRSLTLRHQVSIDELEGRNLIFGIVVDKLRHVTIKLLESVDVSRAPSGDSRNFVVLNSSQFVVLGPQVAFENFCRGEKSENRRISPGDLTIAPFIPERRYSRACNAGWSALP